MNKKPRIPPPAHPHKRREALPWQQPKATDEDPDALLRVQAILNSPSYRRADNDSDFLARDGVRGVRLQIDYLKPELLLEEHEIHQTIVVFGSTRICEPAAARRKVEALRASLAADPSNMELGRRLAIAERIQAKSHYYDVAREFGHLVGNANHGSDIECSTVGSLHHSRPAASNDDRMVFASAMIRIAHELPEFASHLVIMTLGMDSLSNCEPTPQFIVTWVDC